MSKRWYVVHAYSGFEHSVARALKERIARALTPDAPELMAVSMATVAAEAVAPPGDGLTMFAGTYRFL